MTQESDHCRDAVDTLFRRFNEPVIAREDIERWLYGFDAADRPAALALLNRIEYHSQPRVTRETRELHQKLLGRLVWDGFDGKALEDVDFSREFTCKSGDVVSFIYRKSNLAGYGTDRTNPVRGD